MKLLMLFIGLITSLYLFSQPGRWLQETDEVGIDTTICGTNTVTDIDGNMYHTIQIGTQCWMKENMNTTRYANGQAAGVKENLDNINRQLLSIPGRFELNVVLLRKENLHIAIFNLTGNLAFQSDVNCNSGSNHLRFSIGPYGVYALTIGIGINKSTFKVIGSNQNCMGVQQLNNTVDLLNYSDTIKLNASSRYWFDYNNDPAIGQIYGKLYTGLAAFNLDPPYPWIIQGVCPDGWHIPNDEDWKTLELFIGMSPEEVDMIGKYRGSESFKLKAAGTEFWFSNYGTDEYGFTAKGSGMYYNRDYWGFYDLQHNGTWWSYGIGQLMVRQIVGIHNGIYRGPASLNFAVSVRCIKN